MSVYSLTSHVLEVTGIFAFAAFGASRTIERNLNTVAVVLLALVNALGGGLIRDVIIGVPPSAFHRVDYQIAALVAIVGVLFLHTHLPRLIVALRILDAFGLSVLCVHGAAKASAAGQAPAAAAALGVLSVVGGGIMCDVLTGHAPALFGRNREIDVAPVVLASIAATVLLHFNLLDDVATTIVTVCASSLLLLVLHHHNRHRHRHRHDSAAAAADRGTPDTSTNCTMPTGPPRPHSCHGHSVAKPEC